MADATEIGWADAAGLNKMDSSVIRWALWARTMVPNGHFLTTERQQKAAARMVERGFISDTGLRLFGYMIIKITPENHAALSEAVIAGGGKVGEAG